MSDCEFDVVNDSKDYEFLRKSRIIDHWKTVTERYYTPEFYVNPMNTEDSNQDSLILRHSNKLRLTTLSPNHDIIAKDLKVIKVDFETGKKNRMDNKTKGKWKRGAQKLEEPSVIAIIECENKQIFKIRSGVKGNLMEVNRRLVDNPELVKSMTWSNGYIAAILPQIQTGDRFVPAKYLIRKELADRDKVQDREDNNNTEKKADKRPEIGRDNDNDTIDKDDGEGSDTKKAKLNGEDGENDGKKVEQEREE